MIIKLMALGFMGPFQQNYAENVWGKSGFLMFFSVDVDVVDVGSIVLHNNVTQV